MNRKIKVNVQCYVDLAVAEAVDAYAAEHEISVSSVTRRALLEHLAARGIWPPRTTEPHSPSEPPTGAAVSS
jgi:hypothetical protein